MTSINETIEKLEEFSFNADSLFAGFDGNVEMLISMGLSREEAEMESNNTPACGGHVLACARDAMAAVKPALDILRNIRDSEPVRDEATTPTQID